MNQSSGLESASVELVDVESLRLLLGKSTEHRAQSKLKLEVEPPNKWGLPINK